MITFEQWLSIFGNDAQATAREEGCIDCMMDTILEQLYMEFEEFQKGEFDIQDMVQYGNLNLENLN